MRHRVAKAIAGGAVDELHVEASGRIHLHGWTRGECPPPLELLIDGEAAPLREWFRLRRDDVARSRGGDPWAGFALTYLAVRPAREIALRAGGKVIARVKVALVPAVPGYASLYDTTAVLHREHIYAYGPPLPTVDASILSLARALPGPVLDYGCGAGALVLALRQSGIEARGMELDRPGIVQALPEEVKPFVALSAGMLPLPFRDDEFAAVTCVEVLEHIPDWQGALRELARVAPRALLTVPDASAIPTLFPHHVVPWHLLESTHLNFFTQASLSAALAPHFRKVALLRINAFEINGTVAYNNLVACCERG